MRRTFLLALFLYTSTIGWASAETHKMDWAQVREPGAVATYLRPKRVVVRPASAFQRCGRHHLAVTRGPQHGAGQTLTYPCWGARKLKALLSEEVGKPAGPAHPASTKQITTAIPSVSTLAASARANGNEVSGSGARI
jgi:hypothetical protein